MYVVDNEYFVSTTRSGWQVHFSSFFPKKKIKAGGGHGRSKVIMNSVKRAGILHDGRVGKYVRCLVFTRRSTTCFYAVVCSDLLNLLYRRRRCS